MVNNKDRQIIQKLAGRIAEISSLPRNQIKRKEWIDHNDLKKVAPRVLIFPENAWTELLPKDSLECEDMFLRQIEYDLKQKIYHFEHFHDDYVFEPIIHLPVVHNEHQDWGLMVKHHYTSEKNGSYDFIPSLNGEKDLEKMMSIKHEYTFDDKETARRLYLLKEILADTIKADTYIPFYTASIVFELVNLRGLMQLMLDPYDNPDFLHKVMRFMCDSMKNIFKTMEREGRLTLNNGDMYLPSGTVGYTKDLPKDGHDEKNIRLCDIWGFADTQEFTDVSPEIWAEFVYPYQLEILKEFGLVYYGCCEKLDKKFDYILNIPNIRKISVSPWTDISIASEKIGRKAVYCRKTPPFPVICGFNEKDIREDIKNVLNAARNCNIEFVLKDTHTINGHPEYLDKWVDIAQDLCK